MNPYVLSEVNAIGFSVREESSIWPDVSLGLRVLTLQGEGGRGPYYFRDLLILMWLKKR